MTESTPSPAWKKRKKNSPVDSQKEKEKENQQPLLLSSGCEGRKRRQFDGVAKAGKGKKKKCGRLLTASMPPSRGGGKRKKDFR